jgi:pimeloyl-ACP methyl ester carboxylesterase
MPFLEVNGLKVYYEVHGEGEEAIVLLHHGFGCLKIWRGIFGRFVEAGYRVVMYDRRGFGQSDDGPDFFGFYVSDGYRAYSVDELRSVKERLGIGPCHLVGQCEGGVVAVDYAARYPEDVKSIATGSTQCYSEMPMTQLNIERLIINFRDLEPRLQAKIIDWHGEMAQAKYEQFARCGGEYGVEYFDLRPQLAKVQCPALVLYPDRSSIFYVEQATAFYRGLPKGELAVFPKCGHNTYEQRPDDYVRTILDFLERTKQGEGESTRPSMSCLA